MFLDDSGLQRLAYFTGMSNKPQLVDENTLKSMSGYDLYRSVHDSYNSQTDIGYTKNDIAKQIMSGDFTNYSDSGGSAHGKAIYFDVNKGSYGSGSRYAIIHAKLASNAKTISESNLYSMWKKELNSGSKLAKAISRADSTSQVNMYALAKGYDVVIDKNYSNYHMVLNRRALVISNKLS